MPTAEIEAVARRVTEVELELRDLIVLLTRLKSEDQGRTSLDVVLTQYGYTRQQLDAFDDED